MAKKRNRPPGDDRRGPPGPTDADAGQWQGRSIARRFVSDDGLIVLVGRTAADNDILSLKLAAPRDFWLHVAAGPGSHVVVRNPDNLDRLPRATQQLAADLAARHSKAKAGGRTAVHLARCGDVSKPRGLPAGKVTLGRFSTVQGDPRNAPGGG
ncbi:MAG: NFACT RNA binding domain-containing protein [Acidobacteriota bacterium]